MAGNMTPGVVEQLARLQAQLAELGTAIDKLAAHQKQDAKWRMIFRKQLGALVRAQYLTTGIAAPHALEARRFRLRSQNEEDGIILALLQAAGVHNRTFLEIGCGGTGGNSAVLAYELGWSGLMIDESMAAVRAATRLFRANKGVTVMRRRVRPETINRLLKRVLPVEEVDFLSIDIDSVDYWLFKAMRLRARVLVLEYNAHFGPKRAVTVPNAPRPEGAPKGYSGASLTALTKAARRSGYRLVLCEDAGVNAFFVREDLAPGIPTLSPSRAFRPLENKYDPSGESLRELDLYALIEARGLPLVEMKGLKAKPRPPAQEDAPGEPG
jgi:hypothetical protein